MYVELYVGTLKPYRGATTADIVEMIHDTVLHPISHKLGVGEVRTCHSGIYREGRVRSHIFLPFDLPYGII